MVEDQNRENEKRRINDLNRWKELVANLIHPKLVEAESDFLKFGASCKVSENPVGLELAYQKFAGTFFSIVFEFKPSTGVIIVKSRKSDTSDSDLIAPQVIEMNDLTPMRMKQTLEAFVRAMFGR